MYNRETLLKYLDDQGIQQNTVNHPAVFSVEEAQKHTSHLPGAHVKNLFLKAKDGSPWLVTCRDEQTVKVNGLSRLLSAPRFSFAKPEMLLQVLGVEPGSVTPLALINDEKRAVSFVLDRALLSYELLNVHPLINTSTTSMAPNDLLIFAKNLGYEPILVDLDKTLSA